jgi:hypothetical protein
MLLNRTLLPDFRSSTFQVCHYMFLAVLAAYGCARGQYISQEKLQEKVGKIEVGSTTQMEVENLFGKPYMTENHSWTYSLSDTGYESSPNILASSIGRDRAKRQVIPIPAILPTNTRALVTVSFNENDRVIALEVSQYFNRPFINYYHYFLGRADHTLDSAIRAAEMSNFRIAELDKSAGRFLLLEKGASDARIIVKLGNEILHVTSINPYDQMSNEYRLFRRREAQFIERISMSIDTVP